MLLQFRMRNFLSFKEDTILDFTATSFTELIENNTIPYKDERVLKSLLVYGPNASGKTNLIAGLALSFMFIRYSLDKQKIEDLCRAKYVGSNLPIEFEFSFVISEIEYRYGFSVNENKILDEWLFRKDKRETLILDRQNKYVNPQHIPQKKKDIFDAVTNSTLIITYLSNLKNNICVDILEYINDYIYIDSPVGSDINVEIGYIASQFYELTHTNDKDDKEYYKILLDELRYFGFDIAKLKIDKIKNQDSDTYYIYVKEKGMKHFLGLNQLGDGNVKLFLHIFNLFYVMRAGGIFIADEFDSNLHPMLLKRIINRIHTKEFTGQFIFTLHDTNPLRNDIVRRDQIYFVNKNESHESELYSLSDFNVHKNSALDKQYLEGIFGAIPKFMEV